MLELFVEKKTSSHLQEYSENFLILIKIVKTRRKNNVQLDISNVDTDVYIIETGVQQHNRLTKYLCSVSYDQQSPSSW